MNLLSGVDLIEIKRVETAIERHGDRFLKRIFTEAEIELCQGRVESLAVRFAAKEAVAKALGHGIGKVNWLDIVMTIDENRAPRLVLHGEALQLAQRMGVTSWSVSLSHERQYAVAFVVALCATDG
ncbi:MAG: holo-ACP synthase [Chloroflexi bacterium]|nr:holo-ACP synthase [Chloroflexota bacterium]